MVPFLQSFLCNACGAWCYEYGALPPKHASILHSLVKALCKNRPTLYVTAAFLPFQPAASSYAGVLLVSVGIQELARLGLCKAHR